MSAQPQGPVGTGLKERAQCSVARSDSIPFEHFDSLFIPAYVPLPDVNGINLLCRVSTL